MAYILSMVRGYDYSLALLGMTVHSNKNQISFLILSSPQNNVRGRDREEK